MTKYLRALKLKPFVFSKWSISRPGVATKQGRRERIMFTGGRKLPTTPIPNFQKSKKLNRLTNIHSSKSLHTNKLHPTSVHFLQFITAMSFTFADYSPMTICGFFARARDWDIESIPPTITATEIKEYRKEILIFFHWTSLKVNTTFLLIYFSP